MLPYLAPPSFGPINSFGVLVLFGAFFGSTAAYRYSERLGLDQSRVQRMAIFCVVFGLLGAHLLDVFLYQPEWTSQEGAVWTLLNPFAGISSMGGIIGAALGYFLFALFTDIKREALYYADTLAMGLLVLLTFGRAGCASVHDHVGVSSNFVLAVDFPLGSASGVSGPHHDLGLYEFAFLLVLLGVTALLFRKPRRPGLLVGFLAVSYSVPRFFLDFLRRPSSDPRYFDLTPAQWSTLAMLLLGVGIILAIYRREEEPPKSYLQPTAWRTYLADLTRLRPRTKSASTASERSQNPS